jgi:hypothetical protein
MIEIIGPRYTISQIIIFDWTLSTSEHITLIHSSGTILISKWTRSWVEWVELYYDRRSVGQSVLLSSPHLGLMTRFLLLSDHCGFWYGRPLWREDGSVLYNVQCTIYNTFYFLRFETPPTWRTRSLYLYPPGTGWPGYTPRHWVTHSIHSNSQLLVASR